MTRAQYIKDIEVSFGKVEDSRHHTKYLKISLNPGVNLLYTYSHI